MAKRILIVLLILAVMSGLLPGARSIQAQTPLEETQTSELSLLPPYTRFIMEVKWGNVVGDPLTPVKTNFDGSIAVERGQVTLIETLKFDSHDQERDRIRSRANPVAWTSWIFGKWDGVRVGVYAPRQGNVTVETDQGALTIKAGQLADAAAPITLTLSDGRDIVLTTEPYPQRNMLMRVYWGDPEPLARILPAEEDPRAVELNDTEIAQEIQARPEIYPFPMPLPRLVDFSGKLGFGQGATMKFLKTLRFETGQGDAVVTHDRTHASWRSFIANGIDGVLLRASFDPENPRDDTFGIKFGGDIIWSQEYSLRDLYRKRRVEEKIKYGNREYTLVIEIFHGLEIESVEPIPQPLPAPAPLPLPQPAPLPKPLPGPMSADPVQEPITPQAQEPATNASETVSQKPQPASTTDQDAAATTVKPSIRNNAAVTVKNL